MALIFTGIMLLVLTSVMTWTRSSATVAQRNNAFTLSSSAAEAAAELVLAQMASDFYDQNLQSTNNYMTTNLLPVMSGWPVAFSFSNPYSTAAVTYVSINPCNWTTNWGALFSTNYGGVHAYIANCTATSTATSTNQPKNVPATVQLQFQLGVIPVFQYAIFYNLNMEICPGSAMTVTGPVFSNGGIWAGSNLLTFNSPVAAVGTISTSTSDPFSTGYTGSGNSTFSSSVTSNATTVALPLFSTNDPVAVCSVINLPTNGIAPYSSTGQVYFVNQASLIISNSSGGVVSAFYQNSNNVPALTAIPYDVQQVTTNGTTNASYSFASNTNFYDYRESKTVEAIQLNVGALNNWTQTNGSSYNNQLYSDSGHYINSVYVYNNATASSSKLPAVRVANGAVLPAQGLTVITPDPLYVLGNYNASGASLNNNTNLSSTVPAALIADAITVLSANWNDKAYTNGVAYTSRAATDTTVNAATYEGIVPTSGTNYSGGVENFLRLLENWNGYSLTYNGSIVVMFTSQYATNKWQLAGNYYKPPARNWAFDANFTTVNGLPPLTPTVRTVCRQGWSNY